MPREKKPSKAKKFRASSDSDLISQTESEHSNTSEPSSPRKKHKKTAAKKAATARGGSTPDIPPAHHLPPQPILHAGHISAANPFDDSPRSALPPQQQQPQHPQLQQQQQQQQGPPPLPPPQALPRANHPGYMARHMGNPRVPNAGPYPHPGLMNSGYPRGMPPGAGGVGGGYPPGPPQGPLNGPMHPPPPSGMYGMAGNPPGPPLFVCGLCRREVHETEEAILCESGCNAWFHRLCAGLTEPAYSLLTAERLAEWACDRCIREKKIPLVRMKPQPVM